MFDKGRLLESENNGMAIFILLDDCCERPETLLDKAEKAYDEWIYEINQVGDVSICDWVIDCLKENGFKYGRDYRIFTDLYWD